MTIKNVAGFQPSRFFTAGEPRRDFRKKVGMTLDQREGSATRGIDAECVEFARLEGEEEEELAYVYACWNGREIAELVNDAPALPCMFLLIFVQEWTEVLFGRIFSILSKYSSQCDFG